MQYMHAAEIVLVRARACTTTILIFYTVAMLLFSVMHVACDDLVAIV